MPSLMARIRWICPASHLVALGQGLRRDHGGPDPADGRQPATRPTNNLAQPYPVARALVLLSVGADLLLGMDADPS